MTTLLMLFALVAQDDAAATAALDKFKVDYKSKDVAARTAAVGELAKTQHEKIHAKLGQLLGVDESGVRIAAAKNLAMVAENKKKVVSYLIAALAPNSKEPLVQVAILEALGKLKEGAVGEVEKHFKAKIVKVAQAAIEAAGAIGSRTSVSPLIDALKQIEASARPANEGGGAIGGLPDPGAGGIPGGGGDPNERDRERLLKPVVIRVLRALTKVTYTTAKEWGEWWRQNGAKFMSEK
jgi:HEAT repeat protein